MRTALKDKNTLLSPLNLDNNLSTLGNLTWMCIFSLCTFVLWRNSRYVTCADSESFVRGGPNLIIFFCFVFRWRGTEGPKTAINGPSSARQWNAIGKANPWRADDGLILNSGLVVLWFFGGSGPVLQRNLIFLWFFKVGGHLSPLLGSPMMFMWKADD